MAKRGRKPIKSPEVIEPPEPVKPDVIEPVQEITELPAQSDRVIRSFRQKKIFCPFCQSFPTVTRIRRKSYELHYCRSCKRSFEVTEDGV